MAHEFESGFFGFGEVPWHGLGTIIPGSAAWEDIPTLAPLVASNVERVPMYQKMISGVLEIVKGWYLNVREIDQKVVGVIQGKYNIIQNLAAFELGKILSDAGVCDLENVFSLREGKWCVAVFRWKNGADTVDPVHKYLTIVNTFDGSAPLRAFFVGIRSVCMNTVRMALSEAENMLTIRHTESADAKLEEAKKLIETGKEYFKEMDRIFAEMKTKTFTLDQLTATVKKLYKMEKENESKKSTTQNANILNEIIRLAGSGKGSDLPGVQGTAWGAWNAISEYTDHYSTVKIHGTGGDDTIRAAKEQESRLLSNVWGTSNDIKERAMESILEECGIAA